MRKIKTKMGGLFEERHKEGRGRRVGRKGQQQRAVKENNNSSHTAILFPDVVQPSLLGPHIPLLLFPCTCMFNIFLVVSSPSFLNMWPYHLSRLFLRKVVIRSMLSSLQMSSLLMWSFLALPLAHLSGALFLCIVFLYCPAFRPVYHCWLDYKVL